MSKGNSDLTGNVVGVDLAADFEAFNNLSPALRAALNYCDGEYSALEARALLRSGRLTEERLIEILCRPLSTTLTE